jgi:hypothetical protein
MIDFLLTIDFMQVKEKAEDEADPTSLTRLGEDASQNTHLRFHQNSPSALHTLFCYSSL